MAPNVLTGLPLSLSTLVQATKPKDSYPDIVAWAEAKHRVVDDNGQTRLIQFQPVQRAVLRYQFQRDADNNLLFRTMVYSTVKKCMAYGQGLWLTNGNWEKCEDLMGQLFRVWGWDGKGRWHPTFAEASYNGEAECVRIKAEYGVEIVRTLNHPLYTPSGWSPAGGLMPGDYIGVPEKKPEGNKAWTGCVAFRTILEMERVGLLPTVAITVPGYENYLSEVLDHNSGKTEVGGIVARYAAEEMDRYPEVYAVANDRDQAMERTYSAVRRSYELTPGYDRKNRILPGIARVTDVEAKILTTNGVIRTVSLDAKGEAGANPVCSVWSEIWGFDNKPARLLWDEMTPALTRKNSFRYVESYAGIDPDSELLLELYTKGVLEGRQVTAGELAQVTGEPVDVFAECHSPSDLVPLWVNEEAALVVYWDTGPRARRMPWQIGERAEAYYRTEAESLTPESFKRVHLNEWVGATSAFVDASWWAACANPHIPPLKSGSSVPELVIAADGAVSGDCTALVAVSRHPTAPNEVVVRYCKAWTPPVGGKLDYSLTIKPELARLCREYNVLTVVYDPYQLHDLMTEMRKEGFSRFLEFNQGKQRMEADKGLYDLIKGRRIHYNPDPAMGGDVLTQHVHNSASKQGKQEDTKLRIIKKSEKLKIDLTITVSMSAYECLRLYLDPTGEGWSK